MKILLISGFLGAGKTTFIKELIKQTDVKAVVMENEYGDNNLDSLDIQNAANKKDELKVLEFMEGCVCCTMKDSFVNSVFAIYSSLEPEYLIIEPTGVGRLSNILSNLSPLLGDRISLLKPCVIISPDGYDENMRQWQALYEDQVKNAQVSVSQAGLHNVGELVTFLEDCLHGEFGKVARAKGTLWVDNEFLRFDLADRMYLITGSEDDNCQCVVIGQGLDEKKIKGRLSPGRKTLKL